VNTNELIQLSPEVTKASNNNRPVVALETAVLTHGLPFPQNVDLAISLVDILQNQNVTAATIGVLEGKIKVGLTKAEIKDLAERKELHKFSVRDLAPGSVKKWSGGTTVAATMYIANQVDIKVFATGGIGGVHRHHSQDVSADLIELGRNPLVVVCSGAKAILDLPATMEVLETNGIPILGYRTDEFPAFYSIHSGLKGITRCETPREIADIARNQWKLNMEKAVLVANPPPVDSELPFQMVNDVIEKAVLEAESNRIIGSALTPFLLEKVSLLTKGKSLNVNIALLQCNVELAANIAWELVK
jgi:pseudouridine-5'-phosphate glycosidase